MGFFSNFWDKITSFFKTDAGRVIKKSIANLIKLAGPVAIQVLMPIALKQVKLQELQGGLDGAMKADRVRQYLEEYAKQQGIEVGAKVINSILEHAVMSLEK